MAETRGRGDAATLDDIQLELIRIEREMDRVGRWNLLDRWRSGCLLISMRHADTNYLPKGRLTTVAATLKVSTRELSDRMRVAETYRTMTEFKKAARGRTWTGLLRSLEPTREARTGSTKSPAGWLPRLQNALAHVLAHRLLEGEAHRLAQRLYDRLGDTNESA